MLLIEVGEHDIYEGNYWTNRGAKAVDYFLDGSDDYPEAIICANDYMALSICEELKKRGKRLSEVSRSSGKPYPIHASVGICDLKGGDTKHIFACMQMAGERMYINKRNNKKRRDKHLYLASPSLHNCLFYKIIYIHFPRRYSYDNQK